MVDIPDEERKLYKPNSKENSERQPRVERVVKNSAIQRKKSFGKRLAETFTGDDARSVGSYVIFDVMVPAAKGMISDMISEGIERLLFGDSRSRSRSTKSYSGYTSYNRYYSQKDAGRDSPSYKRNISHRARAVHDFDEILIETRGEAEEVLDRLQDLIDNYEMATVADLYDLVGITGTYTDDKWGWVDIRTASVHQVRNGYLLNLPKTISLD